MTDDTIRDQTHGSSHHVGPDVPLWRPRCGVGAAPLAGPESRLLGGGRSGIEPHVLALRWAHRATRPAVDAGRDHCGHEPAVETGVLRLHCPVAAIKILKHA